CACDTILLDHPLELHRPRGSGPVPLQATTRTRTTMYKALQERFGPGLMFAASAVGVSHLVQSTRGGAGFGAGILLVIVLICLLKYPLFLFGAWYTAATGNTVIEGYRQLGRWILVVILAVYLFELPFAIAGISLVSA